MFFRRLPRFLFSHVMLTHFLLKRWVGVRLHVRGRLPQPHVYDDEGDDDAELFLKALGIAWIVLGVHLGCSGGLLAPFLHALWVAWGASWVLRGSFGRPGRRMGPSCPVFYTPLTLPPTCRVPTSVPTLTLR